MPKKARGVSMPDTAEVPISAMIDVIFLLIIFFVVTAAVEKEIEDERVILAEAPHGRPVTKKDPRAIVINVRQDGTFSMGTVEVTKNDIIRQLRLMKQQYENAEEIPIIIRGDHNVQNHYIIEEVMEAVKSTGLYKVALTAQMETN